MATPEVGYSKTSGVLNTRAGIKAIAAADRADGYAKLCNEDGYKRWYVFDADSSETADNDWILQPDAGTGRWYGTSKSSPPVVSSSAPSGTPSSAGLIRVKTDATYLSDLLYISTGTSSSANWVIFGHAPMIADGAGSTPSVSGSFTGQQLRWQDTTGNTYQWFTWDATMSVWVAQTGTYASGGGGGS